jgi:hypothetical protein
VNDLEAAELVYQHVQDNWTACVATYKNERFTPPDGEPWLRVAVIALAPQGASVGSYGDRVKRGRGMIWCQAFAPVVDDAGLPADGTTVQAALALQFAALFEGKDVPAAAGAPCINVETSEPRDVGVDGMWFRYDVRLLFSFQQTF